MFDTRCKAQRETIKVTDREWTEIIPRNSVTMTRGNGRGLYLRKRSLTTRQKEETL